MRYTFDVTSENVLNVYDEGLLVFSRGPYESLSDAESAGNSFVTDLTLGKIRTQDLYGYDFGVYDPNDNSKETQINKYIDSLISESASFLLEVGGVEYDLSRRPERERLLNALMWSL